MVESTKLIADSNVANVGRFVKTIRSVCSIIIIYMYIFCSGAGVVCP